ncbi:hypothetical protein IIA79_06790 [bacterium]|nr:hypothetical protein [bacterium]
MRILEKFDGTWNSATWPERININPIGATSDAAGNIVFAGMDTVGSPRRAVVGILYD